MRHSVRIDSTLVQKNGTRSHKYALVGLSRCIFHADITFALVAPNCTNEGETAQFLITKSGEHLVPVNLTVEIEDDTTQRESPSIVAMLRN